MKGFFSNFIVAITVVGILTRISNHYLIKQLVKNKAVFLTFVIVGLITFPIATYFLGFDIAISEYVIALILWLIVDLLHLKSKRAK